MEQLKILVDVFQLGKIKFESANRKPLMRWISSSNFEERRKRFFEMCHDHEKHSRVGSVLGKRGEYTKPVENLTTKQLRKAIVKFIKTIGLG